MPASVIREVRTGEATDPEAMVVAAWAEDFLVADVAVLASVAAWELGVGETQVIAIACASGAREVALDDLAGRRCALAHGRRVVGTLGLLLRAKKSGLFPRFVQFFSTC